ncbi:HAAS signaling domain-containing protein [Actinopolyspora sp. H202]|uniref:HAAS signaling domain-containing protein n=1 Tax=Actinopolyspora sp. H202 TaxID=1500456 RepID=UPI003EE67CC7
MTTESSEKYRNELMFALRMREVPGDRVGDVLAEVETHVAETGQDPVEAFGTPGEYAARVAEEFGAFAGSPRRAVLRPSVLLVAALALCAAELAVPAVTTSEVTLTTGSLVGLVALLALLLVPLLLAMRAATELHGAGRRVWFGLGALATLVLAPFVANRLEGVVGAEPVLFTMPRWSAFALAGVFLLGTVAVLARTIRGNRIVDPRPGGVGSR